MPFFMLKMFTKTFEIYTFAAPIYFKKQKMTKNSAYEKELALQANRRKATTEFIKLCNDLWYDKAIEIVLFKNQVLDKSVSEILHLHEYAAEFVEKPISIFDSVELLHNLNAVQLPPAKLDIGKLTYEYQADGNLNKNIKAFVLDTLKVAEDAKKINPKDVVLYGFGRIGRLVARELMAKTGKGNQLRLRAIVTRGAITPEVLAKRADLLLTDSVHGRFSGTVTVDAARNALLINGTTVYLISANQPEDIDYTAFGIHNALIIDNTGVFRDEKALKRHLKAKGASKVLLTAPGKGVPNIVYGVNHKDVNRDTTAIFSAASCTTNAISPILKVLVDAIGVKKGHLETIHAYTNDQNLVDNMHSKYRRGRAAALNMVITETGAGTAVAKAIPELEGILTSNAIRVPVPNGSLAILQIETDKKTTVAKINSLVKKHALEGDLVEQIKFEFNNELVSSDIIGANAPAIFDSKATLVSKDGKSIVLYIWYDNESGYSHQVIRLAKYIAKVRRFTYY